MNEYMQDSDDNEESNLDTINDESSNNDVSNLNVTVESHIRSLIKLLSQCIGDISAEKQISYDLMEEYSDELKDCLDSIETGLAEQLKIMEESFLSAHFKCSQALLDHQVEDMTRMFDELMDKFHQNGKFVKEKI